MGMGSKNQKPFAVDFPRNLEVVYFDEDEKICSFYKKYTTSKLRPRTPDICIDPRSFYDCSEDVPEEAVKAEEAPCENKQQAEYCLQMKPTLSYAQIITQALKTSNTGKLTLSEIYTWIEDAFEYYRYANPVWKNSIRHNLSLNKCFKKVPRDPGTRGKGGRWTIDYDFLTKEESKKRRRTQRSSDDYGHFGENSQMSEGKAEDIFHGCVDMSEASKSCDSNDGREDSFSGIAEDVLSTKSSLEQVRGFMTSNIGASAKNVNKV